MNEMIVHCLTLNSLTLNVGSLNVATSRRLKEKPIGYFKFADPEVSRIVAENWGDGVGTTLEQIEAVTNIGTKFSNNSAITSFEEFEKFTGQVFEAFKPEAGFRNCTSLSSIKFPPQMTIIPVYFLSGATSLEIDITNEFQNVTFIGREAFKNTKIYGELSLPKISELQRNGEQFANTDISKVIINGSVETIPNKCFNDCSSLTDVILGENVKYIGNNAFDNCNISKIDLSKVKLVDKNSFINNTELNGTIDLSSIYTSEEGVGVGDCAFSQCGIIDKLIFPMYPFNIGGNTFIGTTVKVVENINYLASIGSNISNNIEQEFDILEFPYLTSVGRYGLSAIKAKKIIFQKLANIGNATLSGSDVGLGNPSYVESLEFSDTLTSITKYGLLDYNKLNNIVFKSITPPELATSYALNNTNNCPIYVPDASVEAYKTATNWNQYADRIKPLSEAYIILLLARDKYIGRRFNIKLLYGPLYEYEKGVTWSITSGSEYASIDQEGNVTINESANNNVITVRATSIYNDTIYDDIDITVTYADSEYLYLLPEETVFNNSNYIDTGIQLMDEDIDYTIYVRGVVNAYVDLGAIFHCVRESSPYPGILMDCTDRNVLRIGYGRGKEVKVPYTYGNEFELKVTHASGTASMSYSFTTNGRTTSGEKTDYEFVKISQTLLIGAYQTIDGSKGRFLDGTISEFYIRDYVEK